MLWGTSLAGEELLPLQWGVATGASLLAAALDVRTGRVPNLLTGPLLAVGLVAAAGTMGLGGVVDAVLGCFLLSFPFVLLFVFAGGGAGDAKLMGALGAWLGVGNGLIALAAVCVSGSILAIAIAVARGQLRTVLTNIGAIRWTLLMVVVRPRGPLPPLPSVQQMPTMPYCTAIFAGVSIAALGVLGWKM